MTSMRAAPFGRWLPGVEVARRYERSWLRHDLIAGVVLTALLIPAGIGYAEAAGLPAGDRAVRDDRPAARLRARRAVADPRARAGLRAGADHRGVGAAAGRRRHARGPSPWPGCWR